MKIFEAMFRNKIGAPSRKELFDNRINVYKEIVRIKNDMENHVYEDFKKTNNSDWFLLQAKEKRINNCFVNGEISEDDYLKYINAYCVAMKQLVSNYIDEQDETSIYGILRNSLKRIKKENVHLLNIDKMEFDLWSQIEVSAEIAQLTISQIINSGEYAQAAKYDKQINSYQVRKHFRK